VKRAIKKTIKTTKKIVRSKIFKYIVIAAVIFFTAGVAAGGFAAFSGVSTMGGFFTAVGQTIATGASAIAGGLGFQGASGTLASYGGAAAEAAGLTAGTGIANAAGVTLAGAAGPGASVTTTAAGTVVSSTGAAVGSGAGAAGSGFMASVKNVMGKKVLGDVSIGQLAANGITTGVTEMLKAKAGKQDAPNGFVAGGLARGGSDEAPGALGYEFGGSGAPEAPQPGEPAAQPEQTVAGQMAQGGEGAPAPANRIQALIAERGPLNPQQYDSGPALAGGLLPQQQSAMPQIGLQLQQPQTDPDRRFTMGATQLQYGQGGLV
jgi:hypothetical protein